MGRPAAGEVPEGERRAHIMRVAAGRFARLGYAAVSISDIAAGVGVTKAAVYHHFPSKDALFSAVMCERLLAIGDAIRRTLAAGGSVREQVRRLAELAVAAVPDDYDTDSLLRDANEHLSPTHQETIRAAHHSVMSAMEEVMREGIARGELRPADPALLAHAFWQLIGSFTGRRGSEAGFSRRPGIDAAVVDLFLGGALPSS